MFKNNRKEKFSLRKYKDGRTDSKLIGAVMIVGLGLLANTGIASANVSSSEVDSATVVTDTSKVLSNSATTFTDIKDPSKNVTVDAVLGKGVAEPTKANYNGAPESKPDGSDVLNFKKEVDVNYRLINAWKTFKTKTVNLGSGKVITPYDKKGFAADTDGKDYRESTMDNITVSEDLGKEDIKKGIETGKLEVDGKIYAYQYSEVLNGELANYDKTKFNDIEVPVSPESLHNNLGEIDYTKLEGRRVFLVEELSDGHYGKFLLAENGVTSDEDAVTKWKEGQANAKDFTKENVTLQPYDTILVMDRDTYATVESSKQTATTKKGQDTYFIETITPFYWDDTLAERNTPWYRRKVYVESNEYYREEDAKNFVSYRKPGADRKFWTSDDIVYNSVYKEGRNDAYRNYLIVGARGSSHYVGRYDSQVYYGTSVLTAFSLPEDSPDSPIPPGSSDFTSAGSSDVSNWVFGRHKVPGPKPTNMLEALKGYAGRVYHAFDFLENSIEEKAKVLDSEEDKKKTVEDKAKVAAARKRLDDYLEKFSEEIIKENIDVGIIESKDNRNGKLVFNMVKYDYSTDNRKERYESVYKFTLFLKGLLKIPQAIGEFSIEGKGPHAGIDDSESYNPDSKVYNEFKNITTGYTFTPVINKSEIEETEAKFKLIEKIYKKQKTGTMSESELREFDSIIENFYYDFYDNGKTEGLVSITSRGREEIRTFKNYDDITEVKLDEKNTKTEEKDLDKFLTKGTVTTLPDSKIKVEHEEVKDTPEYTEEKGEIPEFFRRKITTNKIIRTHVETVDETIYTKKEIITPIRAYKVMSDAKPQINHYFYLTKEERRWDPTVTKQGSVVIKYVTTDGKQLKTEVDKDEVPLETTTLIERYPYEDKGDYYKLYTFLGKVDERNEVKKVEQNYDTTPKQYPTLVDADTGFTYEYVGLKQGSAAASGKVVEGTTEVVYEYRIVSEEEKTPSKSELTKTGSVDVKHVVINEDGTLKTLKSEIIKDKVPVEYEDTYVTYSNGAKVSERKSTRTVIEKYDTTDKQYSTLKDEATGLVYKYVGLTADSAPAEGDITAGGKHVIYSYVLDKKEDNKSKVTEAKDKKGTIIVKFIDINEDSIADDKVVKDNVIVEKVTTTVSGGKEEATYEATGEEYAVTPPQTIEVDGLTFKLKKIVPVSEKWRNSTVEKGLLKEGVTTIVYQYVLQLMKAPEVKMPEYIGGAIGIKPPTLETPEYTGGVVGIEPPAVETPEYTGGVVGIEPPTLETPEYTGGVVGIEPPAVETPEYTGGAVGIEPPTLETPEYTGGAVGIEPPTLETPEYTGGVVGIEPPVIEVPEFLGGSLLKPPTQKNSELEIPKELIRIPHLTPKTSEEYIESIKTAVQIQEKRLANTGGKTTDATNIGAATLIAGILLVVKRRQREDNLN